MSAEPKRWTLEGFVDHFEFVHNKMGDHKYAWVLGAGASKSSGIPLGSELVDRWLKELYVQECDGKAEFKKEKVELKDVEAWATPENLGKDRFRQFKWSERASFYSQIFQRRFSEYPPEGYAYLESVMSKTDPSPGYSILAAALSGQAVAGITVRPNRAPHNVVITTNFDNLVGDAISIYTDTFPLICGHESLAGFAGVALTRPLICKIHRDLLFAPQNDPRSLKRLKDAWGIALTKLFEHYTPLFIGYGGNDDTLMDLLESLEPGSIKGQIVWTHREGSEPRERIRDVVAQHNGVLVPIPEFDLLMILLGERMGIGLLDEDIERRSRDRVSEYRKRVAELDILKSPSVLTAFAEMAKRSEGWWAWEQHQAAEKNPERTEQIYREGIKHLPDGVELCGNFANFLTDERGKHDEAEALYRKTIQLDPNDAEYASNFAAFLTDVRENHDEAEVLYQKALQIAPNDPELNGNVANFLTDVRGKHEEAEALYRKAVRLSPHNAEIAMNFAAFLTDVRGKHEEAEVLYRRALQIAPNDPELNGSFATFLTDVAGEHDEAEAIYQKALQLDPGNAINNENYALFLKEIRESHNGTSAPQKTPRH